MGEVSTKWRFRPSPSLRAYHLGKLPSEAAREILKWYLDIGCLLCGGPVTDIEDEAMGAQCVNSECGPLPGGASMEVVNYSDDPQKSQMPGFSK